MKKVTLRSVNTLLALIFKDVKLIKGVGYFYIASDEDEMALYIAGLPQSGIYVYKIDTLTESEWIDSVYELLSAGFNCKTKLPFGISTIEQAKAFLMELHKNEEHFHPEDDATDLSGDIFNKQTGKQLNYLMECIYKLKGNEDIHKMVIDPCEFLIYLDDIKGEGHILTFEEWKVVKKSEEHFEALVHHYKTDGKCFTYWHEKMTTEERRNLAGDYLGCKEFLWSEVLWHIEYTAKNPNEVPDVNPAGEKF